MLWKLAISPQKSAHQTFGESASVTDNKTEGEKVRGGGDRCGGLYYGEI